MGQAFYRKYRSKKLSEIIGQPHITETLNNALKKGAISHAYLFTGPRGVGKTSIARILAHEVNGFAYSDSTNLDIIEIDAASNRRIDEIRDLREHIHSAPTTGKYKVYIIDEVHMLTKEAFNALLKTLEEPPEHVIFILATTEAHKLPETIISRTQRFTFKPVIQSDAINHLASIAQNEDIKVDNEALELIAEHGQGSFRDSISLLDQVSSGKKSITVDDVRVLLGIAPQESIDSLMESLNTNNRQKLLKELNELAINGYNAPQISRQISKAIRTSVINNQKLINDEVSDEVLTRLIDVPASHDPDTLLEIILLSACKNANIHDGTPKTPKKDPTTIVKPKLSGKKSTEVIAEPSVNKIIEPEPKLEQLADLASENPADAILDEGMWQEALNELKQSHNTLYGVARMAMPTFTDNTVTLSFKFPFHQKRFNDAKNKKILSDILSKLMNSKVDLNCIVDSHNKSALKPSAEQPAANLDTISNIFGSAEVLE